MIFEVVFHGFCPSRHGPISFCGVSSTWPASSSFPRWRKAQTSPRQPAGSHWIGFSTIKSCWWKSSGSWTGLASSLTFSPGTMSGSLNSPQHHNHCSTVTIKCSPWPAGVACSLSCGHVLHVHVPPQRGPGHQVQEEKPDCCLLTSRQYHPLTFTC